MNEPGPEKNCPSPKTLKGVLEGELERRAAARRSPGPPLKLTF